MRFQHTQTRTQKHMAIETKTIFLNENGKTDEITTQNETLYSNKRRNT